MLSLYWTDKLIIIITKSQPHKPHPLLPFAQDGVITRKWEWPPLKLSMPVSVSLYLNVHISLRCTGLTNMDLRVSARGHSYKFPVGPLLEDLQFTHNTEVRIGGGKIHTCAITDPC